MSQRNKNKIILKKKVGIKDDKKSIRQKEKRLKR
jgi:hypothetical protein